MATGTSSDTIVAVASAPGIGALTVVRLSGPRSHEIAERVVHGSLDGPRLAAYRKLIDASGDRIDEGIVIRYDAPRSYTGEDSV